MRFFTSGAAAGLGQTGPFIKYKAAGKALEWLYQKLFFLSQGGAFNVGQMVQNFLFSYSQSLGKFSDGHLFSTQQVHELLPYSYLTFRIFHVSCARSYWSS